MTATLFSRFRQLAVAATLALAALGVAAPAAMGHAAFAEAAPPPGTRLEQSPARITLSFTEPLNRKLTRAELVSAGGERRIPAAVEASPDRQVILRPTGPLETGPYRVEWHTVSTQDGHALEGSFGFGVRAPAVGGEERLEQSPFARDGWLRVGLRMLLYASLFFFAGGVLLAASLAREGAPAGWLVPDSLHPALKRAGRDPDGLAAELWARTVDIGWLALGSAVGVASIEAIDASGGLTLSGFEDFLLTNAAGIARVGTVVAVAFALLHARHMRVVAAGWVAIAFLAIAVGGHANSADPRVAAVLTDWVHLLGASVWAGGIAQVAWAWAIGLRAVDRDVRRGVMRAVLDRFGRIALPAFVAVAVTGSTNALIQLGHPAALWETGYGRVLAVKIALVALIALASYVHARRLRPRLLAGPSQAEARLERRHWRLLRAEPAVAVAVVGAAALLAAFPLPPRQLGETDEAEASGSSAAVCDPCPQRKPVPGELGVAEQAGSSVAAFWLRRDGAGLRGELRLLGRERGPAATGVRVLDAIDQSSCGSGCWRFRVDGRPQTVAAAVTERGRRYVARAPARWDARANGRARALLERAQRTMSRLQSVREDETVTSGPGSFVSTRYRLRAPDRFAFDTNAGTGSIAIGKRQWLRTAGQRWRRQSFKSSGPGFRTRSWFRWTSYARAVRLLETSGRDGRRRATLAVMDEATPVWHRLDIDLGTMRVLRSRMIAEGHFMNQRLHDFNRPLVINPPPEAAIER